MRKRLLTFCIGLGLAALGVLRAQAETVTWLYDVEVPVVDQSADSRAEGARLALLELLTRLTGLLELPDSEAVSQALDAPGRYYNGLGFVERERSAASGEPAEELRLRVQFDRRAVLRLLKSAGLPIWRADRPRVVAWVAVETPQGRSIVGAQDPSDFVAALAERAQQRGVPLVLPLLDLEDQIAVEPAAVWARLAGVLQPASERYTADAMLLGRAQQLTGGTWAMGWELWLGEEQIRFSSRSADPLVLGTQAADFVANELASRLAVGGAEARGVSLAVRDVRSPEDYGGLLRYLRRLEIVDGVAITRVRDNQVDVMLTTRADVSQLVTMFQADRVMTEVDISGPSRYDAELAWHRQ